MIRDPSGHPVNTNAVERGLGCIQVLMAHAGLIESFEEWLDSRGLALAHGPGEDFPTYTITPVLTDAQRQAAAEVPS